MFKRAANSKFANSPALKQESGGEWKTITWKEYYDEAEKVAKSLIALGMEAHDTVNVIGFNSPEWFYAGLGAIMAGGACAGVYTTNEASACEYVASHSEVRGLPALLACLLLACPLLVCPLLVCPLSYRLRLCRLRLCRLRPCHPLRARRRLIHATAGSARSRRHTLAAHPASSD